MLTEENLKKYSDKRSVAIVDHVGRPSEDGSAINLEDDHLVVLQPVRLPTPSTVEMLRNLPPDQWFGRWCAAMEAGAQCFQTADSSATVQVMEERLGRLLDGFDHDTLARLAEVLQKDRERGRKEFDDLFGKARVELTKAVSKYADPNLPDALPAIVEKRMAEAHRAAMKNIDSMLKDGDEGVLARYAAKIVKAVHDDIDNLRTEVIEKRSAHDRSTLKGGTYEEELVQVLQPTVVPLGGEVNFVGKTMGLKKTLKGDVLVQVTGPFTRSQEVRVILEAKDWESSFSENAIRNELRQARANWRAQVGIFVASSADKLPQGRSFGRIDGDFYLAVPRGGDTTALAVVVNLAITQVIQELSAAANDERSWEEARRQAAVVLSLLQSCDPVRSALSATVKNAEKASAGFVAMCEELAKELAKLQALLLQS